MIIFVCLGIIGTIFFGDQWIKNRVEKSDAGQNTATDVIKGYFGGRIRIRKRHNSGAFLNLGQSHRKAVAALSVVLCVAAAIFFIASLGRKGSNLMRVGMAFLLGGAFSNTYDRLKRKYVIDYVSFGIDNNIKNTPWGQNTSREQNTPKVLKKLERFKKIVFNISDFCIFIGAFLTMFSTGHEK